ncbi:adhesin [Paraburkholderia heleia]|uniref:adhesin n=1 Tax=Paraburkholderia heleia TaxID=634127 RepID=UPI000A058CB6|nr:adhesin [Paraburkholderia heleia]
MDHIADRHLDPSVNASQFTISKSELSNLLKDPNTVSTQIRKTVQSGSGVSYVREVDTGRVIGTDKFNNNQPTTVMTVLTDQYGNLVTAFPGKLK